MNNAFDLFEIFDLNERHDMNKMDIELYVSDELKNTALKIVLGLPAFWLFMFLIDIGGDLFYILLLIFTVGLLVIYKYLHTNIIAPWFNKFEELPNDIRGLPNLRK